MVNPEIWLPIIDEATCIGCGDCVEVCPTEALSMTGEVASVTNPVTCNYSGYCEAICPVEAIALPYEVTLDDV